MPEFSENSTERVTSAGLSHDTGQVPNIDERELALREKEVSLKELELSRSGWRNPIFVGLIAASLGLLGNVVTTSIETWNAQRIERFKAQSSLILEAIKTGDQQTAAKNLAFFLELGFIDDPSGGIQRYLNEPRDVPVLPADTYPSHAETLSLRDAKLALEALGLFSGQADNEYTEEFRIALATFQKREGLTPGGQMDAQTSKALAWYVPRTTATSLNKPFGSKR